MSTNNSYYVPHVIEKTSNGERSYDIYSRLLKDRIILLSSPINTEISSSIIAQLLFLQSEDQEGDIQFYINSPGGEVTAGLAIYDTMQFISCDIQTICIGEAASMAAILLSAGAKKKRFCLPNSRIMIHQPWGGVRGTAKDINIQANEIKRLKKSLNNILSKHTGKKLTEIEKDTDRDYFLTPEEAIKYKLVDSIMSK